MGSVGVEVNTILLIIGSSSRLLTMTKTNRGGSAVGCFRAGQQQAEVGFSYSGASALQGPSRHERRPLGCQNPFQYTEALQRKKLQPRTFVPLFVFLSVLLVVHR